MVAVSETTGAIDRGLRPATDHDRQPITLVRQRPEGEVIDLVETAAKRLN